MAAHTQVMTGATRGIGRIAAQHILDDDPAAHLVVIARGDGGAALAGELDAGGGRVTAVSADLGSLASVRHAAVEIASRLDAGELPPLRGLVGNAGIQHTNALTETPDGLEATFAVNVLANHVIVRELQPRFERGSRITITVSDTHFGDFSHNLGMVPAPSWKAPATLARIAAFDRPTTAAAGRTAYSTSKLAAIHWVHEASRQLPDVEVVSFNPGFVPGTDLARNAGPVTRFLMRAMTPLLTSLPIATTPAVSARHLADLVVGRTAAPSGAYVDRGTVAPSSDESHDPAREADLWATLEHLTAP